MCQCFISNSLNIPADNWTFFCEGENTEEERYSEHMVGGQLNSGGKAAPAILSRRKNDLPVLLTYCSGGLIGSCPLDIHGSHKRIFK